MEEAGPSSSSPPRSIRVRPERCLKKEIPNDKLKRLHIKWSTSEMKLAMEGLNKYGLTRMDSISKPLIYKTPQQVKGWLWKMGRDAYKMKRPSGIENILHQGKCALGVSLAISNRYKSRRISTKHFSAITKSLLLIENLENHPSTSDQEINFKQLYNVLYMAMKGYPLPKMNKATLKFLIESLHYLLRVASSDPIKNVSNEYNEVLKNICKSTVLNPQSMYNNLLQGSIDEKLLTNGYDGRTEVLASWLNKQDWNLI